MNQIPSPAATGLLDGLRPAARQAPESGIVALANYGRSRQGVIPLWAGEGDLPTPDFISRKAADALAAGETFYTWQRGVPDLRAAIARYHERHFGHSFSPEEFFVTGGGMQAIQLALQAVAGAGDEVIYFTPAWPNFAGAAGVAGIDAVPLQLTEGAKGWKLDMDALRAAITPRTRALFVNTPSNPTGWTADSETLATLLSIAREQGLWIIADEIYTQFYYDGLRAPSFMDIMAAEDRILFVNTFSKNWAMTGWRMGWIRAHPSLGQVVENLIQYSTSGVPAFLQRGAVAALDEGDGFVAEQVERARRARDIVCAALTGTGRVRLAPPEGAFYLFFAIDGVADSYDAAFRIVDEAGVGVAPGTAFGAGGAAHFRLCFHRRLDQVEDAAHRLARWVSAR